MNLEYSAQFIKRANKLCKRSPQLKNRIASRLKLLFENPSYPSLRLHKLEGGRKDHYSVWIDDNLRLTLFKDGSTWVLTDLITHDEY